MHISWLWGRSRFAEALDAANALLEADPESRVLQRMLIDHRNHWPTRPELRERATALAQRLGWRLPAPADAATVAPTLDGQRHWYAPVTTGDEDEDPASFGYLPPRGLVEVNAEDTGTHAAVTLVRTLPAAP